MAAVSLWKLFTDWKNSRWLPLPWKPRYQNNGVGWRPPLLCNGNSSYVTPTSVGWRIAILLFFFTIILPHIFVRSISRRCLDQTLWNLVKEYHMPCEVVLLGFFFQNGSCCHRNGQNAKKNEKYKNDHSRLLAEQKLMKLDRNNIHI